MAVDPASFVEVPRVNLERVHHVLNRKIFEPLAVSQPREHAQPLLDGDAVVLEPRFDGCTRSFAATAPLSSVLRSSRGLPTGHRAGPYKAFDSFVLSPPAPNVTARASDARRSYVGS